MQVAVVGAGICGLAAAYELQRRGASVTVHEAESVGAGQSIGLARIFRIAHAQPELCALALEAREGWLAWEREFGVHLLGDEGLVVVGDDDTAGAPFGRESGVDRALHDEVRTRAAAMRAAGAPVEPLSAEDVRARLPFLDYDWGGAIFDPLAGSLRIPAGARRARGAGADRAANRDRPRDPRR